MKLRTVWLGILLVLVCWIPRCEATLLEQLIQAKYEEVIEKLTPQEKALLVSLSGGPVPSILLSPMNTRNSWVTLFNPYTSQSTIIGISYVPAPY